MLKHSTIQLSGRDRGVAVTLTELPALVADRHARAALAAIGAPVDGGVVSLALQHVKTVLKSPDTALLLQPFVQADVTPRDWLNILALQQAALALHVGFLVGRPQLEIPVGLRVEASRNGAADLGVHFCSPHIATVLHSGRATYRELETVLSTEDVFNLVELTNVEAIRDWRAAQTTGPNR